MVTEMYVVYDKIALESGPVFHAKNNMVAARSFYNLIAKENRPDDFELLHIGSFEHDTATADMRDVPEKVPVSVKPIAKSEEIEG